MLTYLKTETDVGQNLIHDFFLILTVRGSFHRKDFKWKKKKKMGVYAILISEKTEVL